MSSYNSKTQIKIIQIKIRIKNSVTYIKKFKIWRLLRKIIFKFLCKNNSYNKKKIT